MLYEREQQITEETKTKAIKTSALEHIKHEGNTDNRHLYPLGYKKTPNETKKLTNIISA